MSGGLKTSRGIFRVLLVESNEDGTVGGSHQILVDVVTTVDRRRFEPVVCFYQDNVHVRRLREAGVEVHVLDAFRDKERRRRVGRSQLGRFAGIGWSVSQRLKFLREWKINLLHLNNSPHVGFSDWLPAARLAGVPVVAAAMGDADAANGKIRRRIIASFDHYLPVSHYMASALLRQGIDPSRITTVQAGVDLPALRSRLRVDDRYRLREALSVPDSSMLGVMVGNIRPWKGQHVVLEALAHLKGRKPAWVVAFAGAEDAHNQAYAALLREQAADLEIEDNVRWLGRRNDVPNVFHAADVGLHASVIPEPFGLVMVECMAVGTPVIAAQEGGAAEIVTTQTGWTYPGGDAAALAQCMLEACQESPSERQARHDADVVRANAFDSHRMSFAIQDVWSRFAPMRRVPDWTVTP